MEDTNFSKNSICYDISLFQDNLKKMRLLDDKIVYTLNTSLPTDSFKKGFDGQKTCKELHSQLESNFISREKVIKQCIDVLADEVRSLKQEKNFKPDDVNVIKLLRREQTSLRVLQTELGVEEIIKEKTTKVFHDRCRNYYSDV